MRPANVCQFEMIEMQASCALAQMSKQKKWKVLKSFFPPFFSVGV
jgi:hypothetical protein